MPTDFDQCVKEQGEMSTKSIGKTKYMHLCKDEMGKMHKGEVKTKKVKKPKK